MIKRDSSIIHRQIKVVLYSFHGKLIMKLESLSNELLLTIFDYMSMGQILHSFPSLNSRFYSLTDVYLRSARHLDSRFMSLNESNIFFQSQLPGIMHRIISITIENEDAIPLRIEFFRCDDFRFRQFNNLQLLSLYHIHSHTIMLEVVHELNYLPHLISIDLIDCCGIDQSLMNIIWKMPKLIHCSLSTRSCSKNHPRCPSVIS